jgi:uronate dehydrogenase
MSKSNQTVLVTGAAGLIGGMLRTGLATPGRTLRLLDPTAIIPAPGEQLIPGSVTDRDLLAKAVDGVDAVIHLGGVSSEGSWADVLSVNVDGTQAVLQSAVDAGVGKVVLASSNHAAGFWTRDDAGDGQFLRAGVAPRPDTFYGWSKAAGEALSRLYHDRFGLDVVNIRIGTSAVEPPDVRALATWMSPRDTVRVFAAALSDQVTGFHIVWGVSNNTRRWWTLDEGAAIGYKPVDDAEHYADALLAESAWNPNDPALYRVGGPFCGAPLGEPM